MKGVILAGGEGKRLRPYTLKTPKPMVPIMNKPVMEYSIKLLKEFGITDIYITIFYKGDSIKNYFQNGEDWGVNITYLNEYKPLGSAGGIFKAKDLLDEPFIIISGDAFTNLSIEDAVNFHFQKKALVTIVSKNVENPLEYGICQSDENGKLVSFVEKPNDYKLDVQQVNTGIYVMDPKVIREYSFLGETDFSRDVFPALLRNNERVFVYNTPDYWRDIGSPDSYRKAREDYLRGYVTEVLDQTLNTDWLENMDSLNGETNPHNSKYITRLLVPCPSYKKQEVLNLLFQDQHDGRYSNRPEEIFISHWSGGWTRIIDEPSKGFIIYSKASRRNLAKEFANYYFKKIKQWQKV
jgi:NDP-sugar pyrophosphorylase family protein